jgi:hypothetical protein
MAEPTDSTATEDTTTNAPEPTATAPDNSGNTGEQMVSMPQSQFDAIVQREKAQAKRSALAELGDVDELKAAKAELDNIKTEQLSELEKSQKRIADLEAQAEKAEAQRRVTMRDSAVKAAAHTMGFRNLDDAVSLVDMSAITISVETGKVEGETDALKALAEKSPYLIGDTTPKAPNLDGGAGKQPQPGDSTVLTAEQRAQADRMGIPHEYYAKSMRSVGNPLPEQE